MMNNNIHIHQYESAGDLIERLAAAVMADLEDAIRVRGYAVLLVSGGSTPKPLFERMRRIPFAWEKVRIGLCDERWVESDHPDSNEKLIRATLLQEYAADAEFVGWYTQTYSAEEAEILCSDRLKERLWPIDAAVLGMGEDGHTASLFPNNPKLIRAFDPDNETLCISMLPSAAPHLRLSLTLKALLSAHRLYLHFEGEKKRQVFDEAMRGTDVQEMPIRALLHQESKDIEVYYA